MGALRSINTKALSPDNCQGIVSASVVKDGITSSDKPKEADQRTETEMSPHPRGLRLRSPAM